MFQLRIKLTECLMKISDKRLEAHLCALACVYLVTKNLKEHYTEDDRKEANEILDRVLGRNPSENLENKNKSNASDNVDDKGLCVFREFLKTDTVSNLINLKPEDLG
jgi:hypothetical protein